MESVCLLVAKLPAELLNPWAPSGQGCLDYPGSRRPPLSSREGLVTRETTRGRGRPTEGRAGDSDPIHHAHVIGPRNKLDTRAWARCPRGTQECSRQMTP